MWLTEAVLYMYVVVTLTWENLIVRSRSDVIGAVYRRVLEAHFATHGRVLYRNNWLLVDDNPRPHRARVVDAYLRKQCIRLGPLSSGYEPKRTYLGRNWSWFGGIGPLSQ